MGCYHGFVETCISTLDVYYDRCWNILPECIASESSPGADSSASDISSSPRALVAYVLHEPPFIRSTVYSYCHTIIQVRYLNKKLESIPNRSEREGSLRPEGSPSYLPFLSCSVTTGKEQLSRTLQQEGTMVVNAGGRSAHHHGYH